MLFQLKGFLMQKPMSKLPSIRRRVAAISILLTLATVASCGAGGNGGTGDSSEGDPTPVRVGTLQSSSDAPHFIAQENGYFEEEGIDVEFVPFKSSTDMIGPLGQGQLDVGMGGLAAAMANGLARGTDLKIVADKGTNIDEYSYPLMVRTELIESGQVESIEDLKGKKFAVTAEGAVLDYLLAKGLEGSGVDYDDVELVTMPFPDMVNGFENGAIDAAIIIEPFATQAVERGVAKKLASTGDWANDETVAVTMFSGRFADGRHDDAVKYLRAYVKGIRFYLEALESGKFEGPNADDVIDILTKHTLVDDPAVYQALTPTSYDPDGMVKLEPISEMLAFWEAQGFLEGDAADLTAEDMVDLSILKEALKDLPEEG